MAPKVPKPIPKVMDKPVERLISKSKKHKKKKYHNFSIYIFKLLRAVSKDKTIGISRLTMVIMNNFINDMFEKIATEAGKFAMYGKKHTLGSREVQSAIKLVMPGELAKHANIEGTKAITMYHNSREADFRTKKPKPKPKATAVVGPVQT